MLAWEEIHFPNVESTTTYEVVQENGGLVLKATSNQSASALVTKKSFDISQYGVLRWRWKASKIYERGDATTKSGDDYPLRVFLLFEQDEDVEDSKLSLSLYERLKYNIAESVYGNRPPFASLNYIWANKPHDIEILESPYSHRSRLLIRRSGDGDLDRWVAEEVMIVKDYRLAFDERPPKRARIAVMNDSDNTKESSVSFFDDIQLSSK